MQAPGASAGLAHTRGQGGHTEHAGPCWGKRGERTARRMDEDKGRGCFAG